MELITAISHLHKQHHLTPLEMQWYENTKPHQAQDNVRNITEQAQVAELLHFFVDFSFNFHLETEQLRQYLTLDFYLIFIFLIKEG